MAEGYAEILELIKDFLETMTLYSASSDFTTVGNVHDYERLQNIDGTILTFRDAEGNTVPEWTITRGSCPETAEEQIVWRNHNFIIRGYFPIDDAAASEKKFQKLVDDIQRAFRYADTMQDEVWLAGPASLTRFEPFIVPLEEQLCHYAEISLPIIEKVGIE